MDQEKANPKIVLWRKPVDPENTGAWTRLSKALRSFAELEEIEAENPINEAALLEPLQQGKKVVLDLALADIENLSKTRHNGVILVRKDPFQWNTPRAREALLPVLVNYPCLTLEGISATDLLRLLYLFLVPKNQSGVCPLMEKGALVLAEKVQGLESIGLLLDRFSTYLAQAQGLELKSRIVDFRQTVTAFLVEAYQRAAEAGAAHPTVEFQTSVLARKIALHFRFPLGNLDPAQLPQLILNGESLRWHLLWQSCDALLLTHHQQHREIEAHVLFFSEAKSPNAVFKSFLYRSLEHSGRPESAMVAPKDYQFSVFSEIKVLKSNVATADLALNNDEIEADLDLASLPVEVSQKISKLEIERNLLKEFAERKEKLSREHGVKIAELTKEIAQRRGEIFKLQKAIEHSREAFSRKAAEYEKRILSSQTQAQGQKGAAQGQSVAGMQMAVTKLEGGTRALEQEKTQLAEKLKQEQKRVSMYEQKYSVLFKDIVAKDKEIQDLKAGMLKLSKEHGIDEARGVTGNHGTENNSAKLKEAELREQALKQELRKLQFKLDNHDKNLKAQQTEAGEKAKLMEQKLQAAKTRELELLKKIEELSSALKKAAKVA